MSRGLAAVLVEDEVHRGSELVCCGASGEYNSTVNLCDSERCRDSLLYWTSRQMLTLDRGARCGSYEDGMTTHTNQWKRQN